MAIGASFLDLSSLTCEVNGYEPVEMSIFCGGGKSALLKNPAVQDIIADRYKITLHPTKADSIEMAATLDTAGKACLCPSNMVAAELARQRQADARRRDDLQFADRVLRLDRRG